MTLEITPGHLSNGGPKNNNLTDQHGAQLNVVDVVLAPGTHILEKAEDIPHFDPVAWIDSMVWVCHGTSYEAGWWQDRKGDTLDVHNGHDEDMVGAMKLGLIHSEISEALEGLRTHAMDDHLPEHHQFSVELADAVIRIFDLAGAYQVPLGRIIMQKLFYNRARLDHQNEARRTAGGKRF